MGVRPRSSIWMSTVGVGIFMEDNIMAGIVTKRLVTDVHPVVLGGGSHTIGQAVDDLITQMVLNGDEIHSVAIEFAPEEIHQLREEYGKGERLSDLAVPTDDYAYDHKAKAKATKRAY